MTLNDYADGHAPAWVYVFVPLVFSPRAAASLGRLEKELQGLKGFLGVK